MTTPIDFLARARKGVAFLEEFEPGSTGRIDTETLDIADTQGLCAACQALGLTDYIDALDELFLWGSEAIDHGFALSVAEMGALCLDLGTTEEVHVYAPLNEAWREALAEHRATR